MDIQRLPSLGWLDTQFAYDPRSGVLRRMGYRDLAGRWREERVVPALLKTGGRGNISLDGFNFFVSRICYKLGTGEEPVGVIDHIDGDPGNNRMSNLRDVGQAENMKNRRRQQSVTGITGVVWRDDCNKYQAQIRVDGKELYLGLFDTKKEAARVRKMAEREHGFHENHGSDRGENQ